MDCIRVVKSSLELQPHQALLCVALVVISALALFLGKAFCGRPQHWPPGPPSLPLIGHLHLLLGSLPHQSLSKLSQTYGPFMGLRLGPIPTIIASSPDMAKEILQTHDLAFADRPPRAAAFHTCFGGTDVGFSPYGPHWKLLRQLYATELFSAKRFDSFRYIREEETRALSRSLLHLGLQGGKGIKIQPSLVATTRNINYRMVMGERIEESSNNMNSQESKLEFFDLVEEIMHLLGVFYIGDYIPWLAWLDPYGYLKRMKVAGKKIEVALQDMIKKRKEYQQGNKENQTVSKSFLDALLAASQNKDFNIEFTDKTIMAAILDIFVGGVDTSALTVEWTLAELIKNPKAMEKLQKELDDVVGRERLVEERDIPNLPFLGAIVKESMRLHPVAPLLIPRECIQECHVGGYAIPPKTQAYINLWAMGRSSFVWNRPLDFLPERFEDTHIDLRGQHFQLLPFGSGRRKCPGWTLGFTSVHLMLASLAQGFTWSSPIDLFNLDMSEKFGLTMRMEKPLHAIATPRLPMDLY